MIDPITHKTNLLTRFASQEITLAQFLYKCALWTFEPDVWQELRVKPYPTEPRAVFDYNMLTKNKRDEVSEKLFNDINIRLYFQQKQKVYADNWASYQWLLSIKKLIPDDADHLAYHLKLDERLVEFEAWFKDTSSEIENAKETFNAQEVI